MILKKYYIKVYLILSFKVVSYQLIKFTDKNSTRLNEQEIRSENDILVKNKNNIKSILTNLLENREVLDFLRKTLCRYASLEENLTLLLKKNTI